MHVEVTPYKMYHNQQIKCETKTEVDQYMRVTGRYGNGKMQDSEKQSELGRKSDPYPWLADDDPRRYQTDEEILYEKIDLSNSALCRKEKTRLTKMLIKYRDAFSLRDEIGECPNVEADIKVIDDSPFFVRPFPISESDKPFMDQQMERLVSLGILSKNSTSHTSPVMLITRKLTKDKRPVVDFRLLNTRILRRNTSIPLMSDVLSILGNSECEVVSCVDIKDAYNSITLTEKSKEYCGVLPNFGSPIYRYEVLPMGIACAPQIWMDYMTLILSELEDKKKYIAIMDDLLIHSTKVDHWKLLEQLLKSMRKYGLRLSPKKCQLFTTNLIYMILSDYLSRHRQKDLDPSELIPISFCCLEAYRSFIADKMGEDIFCVKTRASAKASGEIVGEVHGADKPLDPNYKPEHQSKSKLPNVTGKSSPIKTIRKPILQTLGSPLKDWLHQSQ